MTALGYAFTEALVSLRRSARSATMSIGTIAIAFLTLGGFLLISANLQSAVDRWASAAEMSVFLQDTVDDAARQTLLAELGSHPTVAAVEFVSKEEALVRFKNDFPELADVATSAENPFPPSIEVRLRTDAASSTAAETMAQDLAQRQGIVDVRFDRLWLARLLTVITSVRVAGLAIAAILVLGAAFTVAAVVRLSLQARREELDIMQLVGAPFSFIRGPAVAEGAMLGAVGALLSLVVLWTVFAATRSQLTAAVAAWGNVGELRFLSFAEALALLVSAFVVGGIAGLIASRAVR